MPVAETRRVGAAGMSFAWRIGGRLAIAAGALAFVAALVSQVEVAAAKSAHSSTKHVVKKSDDDDSNNDSSNNATPAAAVAGETNPGGAANVPSVTPSTSRTAPNGNLIGGSNPNAPHVSVGFNNDSASVNASIPFGGLHHAVEAPSNHVMHPLLTIPFDHNSPNLSHALAPAPPAHALSYGDTGTPLLGGSPNLTNRLIRSVAPSYSDHFVHRLGDGRCLPQDQG